MQKHLQDVQLNNKGKYPTEYDPLKPSKGIFSTEYDPLNPNKGKYKMSQEPA